MKHIKLFEAFVNEMTKTNWQDFDFKKAIGETIKTVKLHKSGNQDYVTLYFKSNKSLIIYAESSPQDAEAYVLAKPQGGTGPILAMKGKTISDISSEDSDELTINFTDNSEVNIYADTTGNIADLAYIFKK